MKWILASASPRRKELIAHICREFEIKVADADETVADTDCAQTVQTLALRKALAIGPQEDAVVIGADTLVAIGQEILGKPKDREDAARMLRLLSGNVHQVYTGVAIVAAGRQRVFYEKTDVYFVPITPQELEYYLDTANYQDKAGAYAIQMDAAKFITRIDGCYHNVVGLPVGRLYQELKQMELLS